MSVARRLLSEGRQQAGSLLILAVGLGLVSGFLIVWQSRLISQIINAAFMNQSTAQQLEGAFLTCFVIMGLRAAITWGSDGFAHQAAARIKRHLRQQLVSHLMSVGPAILLQAEDDEGHTGELANTALEGIEALEAYYRQYLPQLALAALVPLSLLIFIAPLDPLTGTILLVTAPLLPLFMYLIGNAAKNQTRRQWQQLSRMSAYFLEVLQGLTTLKALGRSREQANMIDQVSENHRRITMSVLRITFLSALALEMIATLGTAVVAVEIGLRLLYGRLAFEQAFFLLLLAPEFYLPLRLLGLQFHAGMAGVEAGKRIIELLYIPTTVQRAPLQEDGTHLKPRRMGPPKISFQHVRFAYRDGRTALDDINIDIPAGKVTVIVGESGAGKSTILAMLLGFFTPQKGCILVDGTPLDEMRRQDLVNNLAWVPQHPHLFQDSLAANISLGKPGASQEDIQNAAQLAHADDFIQALPLKYTTPIGERGVRLSAGQAQRVAIARAYLQDAPLLLLDEPGAHLDSQTDQLLLESLNNLMRDRTVIVITHQPFTNLHADQTIWIEDGRVIRIDQSCQEARPSSTRSQEAGESYPLTPDSALQEETDPEYELRKPSALMIIARLLRLLSPFKARVMLSILLGTLTIGSSMGLMATAAYLISKAALQPSIAELQVAIVGVRFFGLARGVFRYLERLMTHEVTFRLLGKWRGWFYRAIEPLVPAGTMHRHSGDLLQHIGGDVATLEDFYVRGFAPPLVAIMVGGAAFLFLAQFHITLALFLAGCLLVSGIGFPVIILILAQKPGRQLVLERARLNQVLVDSIQGMPDLLAFGQAERQLQKIRSRTESMGQVQGRLAVLNGFQAAAGRLLADLCLLGILWQAILLVIQGQLDGVVLGALALLAFSSFEAFFPLTQAAHHLSASLTAADRLFALVDTQPQVSEPAQPVTVPDKFHLQVHKLTFRYPQQTQDVLINLSFQLEPGGKIAITGTSGAGKSTFIQQLLRFWESPQGSIQINGVDLNHYAGDELRKRLAVLPQNPSLFSGTIYDNIRLAVPQANKDEVEKAAQRACLHDWIQSLPQGYQTWVGEGGLKLSGGQRQRIALARALLRHTPMLILDEPTAHLDAKTEQEVMQGIFQTVEENGSSLLLVTHNMTSLDRMDEILVLQNGAIFIKEKGRPVVALETS